jgi:hypothetical protein
VVSCLPVLFTTVTELIPLYMNIFYTRKLCCHKGLKDYVLLQERACPLMTVFVAIIKVNTLQSAANGKPCIPYTLIGTLMVLPIHTVGMVFMCEWMLCFI